MKSIKESSEQFIWPEESQTAQIQYEENFFVEKETRKRVRNENHSENDFRMVPNTWYWLVQYF